MKYKIVCRHVDAPGETCSFEAVDESQEAVVRKILDHARTEHREETRGMTDEEVLIYLKTTVTEE